MNVSDSRHETINKPRGPLEVGFEVHSLVEHAFHANSIVDLPIENNM